MPDSVDHPDRLVPLEGATNFRDLGGYRGHGGRPVRWRRVYRSEHLGRLTAADRAALAERGVARVLDFRGVRERAAEPYELPGAAQHSLAIEPTVIQRMQDVAAAGQALTAERMVALMEELYCRLVDHGTQRFAAFFGHLLEADAPLVFHCTAGKDRTGLAAALLLRALGVSREAVVADYLLTNRVFVHPPMPDSSTPPEALAVLWKVQQRFLDTALDRIDTAHGGLDRYLAERLGVGPAERTRLAARYLED